MRRGSQGRGGAFVEERISGTGRFSIRRGRSMGDHLDMVADCRGEYAKMVTSIERLRMGAPARDGHGGTGGRPLAITYPEVGNLERFVDAMFDAKEPFRLWDPKMLRKRGQYSVPAVDLHGGSIINFEITPHMMRIYLGQESRGSAVLRLLANLQAHHSAQAECADLE
ncbi:MAG: hypothetical protein EB832_04920 [Thaumarchaeota archaeon S14]|nr:MAG: hypothetical protein EB832_04920 [Thaumarchaeota archaeon S14]